MKFSLNWLNKYVDLSGLSPKQISDRLTFAGIEVEGFQPLAYGDRLVVGQILEVRNHPDSDHLHVLSVDLGAKYGLRQIVCGAPNVKKGLKVIVALENCHLANDVVITPSTIRGVESNGMCCSLSELGVEHKFLTEKQIAGIEELPDDAKVGNENVLSYLGLDDVILDLKLLANRPDCSAAMNLARELGGLFERKISLPSASLKADFDSSLKVESQTDKCPLFTLMEVKDIKVKSSPKWLKAVLMASGIRSINNVVDIGNYIMLLTGQPLHMYDLDKVKGESFVVRDDIEDENWVALDDNAYHVVAGDIAITVNNKTMCLGGVMGSKMAEVDASSKHIAVEAALFDGATIRHTSTRLNLVSDSSSRFAKGINPHQSEMVLALTARLLRELAGAKEISNVITYDQINHEKQVIGFSIQDINHRLGTSFSLENIKKALTNLSFKIREQKLNSYLVVEVPDFRIDISGVADLSEEIIRYYGYDNVVSTLPVFATTVGGYNSTQEAIQKLRHFLLNNGLNEALTYSLISEQETKEFSYLNKDTPFKLLHPMTPEHALFRTNTLSSLLKVAEYNVAHQMEDFALFEVSNAYGQKSAMTQLSVVLVGQDKIWGSIQKENYNYYHSKGLIEGIFLAFGIEPSRYRLQKLSTPVNEFHPGRSAEIFLAKDSIAVLGELHPEWKKNHGFNKLAVVALTLNLDALLSLKTSPIKSKAIAKYPFVRRDLAFVIDQSIAVSEVEKCIKKAGRALVKNVEVFDIYQGEHVQAGMKSIALSVFYGDDKKTLTDGDVRVIEDEIKSALFHQFKAELRG